MEDYQLPAQTEYKGDLELQQEIADEQAQLEVNKLSLYNLHLYSLNSSDLFFPRQPLIARSFPHPEAFPQTTGTPTHNKIPHNRFNFSLTSPPRTPCGLCCRLKKDR